MSRTGVTFDDVARAAREIEERGESVTINSVRNSLGTGSMGTISRHLADYRSSVYKRTGAENISLLSDKLKETLAGQIAEIVQKSNSHERQAAELAADQLNDVSERLRQEEDRNEELKAELSRSVARYESLADQLAATKSELEMVREQLNKTMLDRATFEMRGAELIDAKKELTTLREAILKAEKNSSVAETKYTETSGRLSAVEGELDVARKKIVEVEKAMATLQATRKNI